MACHSLKNLSIYWYTYSVHATIFLTFQTKEELKAEPDVDDILSPSASSGFSTPSSFEFMTEEMFLGNQRTYGFIIY